MGGPTGITGAGEHRLCLPRESGRKAAAPMAGGLSPRWGGLNVQSAHYPIPPSVLPTANRDRWWKGCGRPWNGQRSHTTRHALSATSATGTHRTDASTKPPGGEVRRRLHTRCEGVAALTEDRSRRGRIDSPKQFGDTERSPFLGQNKELALPWHRRGGSQSADRIFPCPSPTGRSQR